MPFIGTPLQPILDRPMRRLQSEKGMAISMWALSDSKGSPEHAEDNFTFLARGVEFKGVLNFDGTVRVDGRLEGEIHTTGMVIVGESAVINGIISAGVLTNSGKINGTVTATERVQILKQGVLIGDIRTPAITIADGAHFHGMCDMGADKWTDDANQPNNNVRDLSLRRNKMRAPNL